MSYNDFIKDKSDRYSFLALSYDNRIRYLKINAYKDLITKLEKQLIKEKKQAEKHSLKQKEILSNSPTKAQRSSINAKVSTCWEQVRLLELDIMSIKELLEEL